MSKKFRLFASVAVPLMSLPAVLQPAYAAPPMPIVQDGSQSGLASGNTANVIRVQQAAGDDEQERKKKKAEGQEKGGKPEKAEKGGDDAQKPQRKQANDDNGGARPQRAQSADSQNADQKPQRKPQAADDAGQAPAQMKPPKAAAQQPSDDAARPARTPKPDAAQEKVPSKAQEKAQDTVKTAAPEKPAAAAAEKPAAAAQGKAQAPAAASDDAQAPSKPRPPKSDAQMQGNQMQDNQPGDTKSGQMTPGQKPSQDNADQGKPGQRPSRDNADQGKPGRNADNQNANSPNRADQNRNAPDASNPANADAQQNGRPPRGGQMQGGQMQGDMRNGDMRNGQPQNGQPQNAQGQNMQGNQPAGQQPALRGTTNAQADDNAPRPPVQTAKTPEQVERAKQLAKDPAAAKAGEQVVLPVQNGAPVLDSAKQGQNGRPQRAAQGDQNQPPPPRPKSDADAQATSEPRRQELTDIKRADDERGQKLDKRPKFERPNGWEVLGAAAVGAAVGYAVGQGQNNQAPPPPGYGDRDDGRVIMRIDNQEVVRHDDSRRFYDDRRPPEYDQLSEGRVREVIVRDDGTRIVTIRNRYGEVVQRSRIVPGGNEYVLYYAPQLVNENRGSNYVWRDPGDDLPPMRLSVPVDDYIADTSSEPNRNYYQFLEQPPVERVQRVYSLDEVRYSARVRDMMPRIDLDTITFPTGSADISMNQAGSLKQIADGIKKVLDRDPSESFLIEGHTDAVGSPQSNLVLSDQRAESVAQTLTQVYGIPPENMATQGYGEQFLKVQTDGPNQENRRVTIRRITPLVRPVASNQ